MKQQQNKVEILIKRVETQSYSFLVGFLSLFAIILCRNIFESTFEGSQILGFSPIYSRSFYMIFIHFPLFYISIFLWILFIFILLTKENCIKISKALLLGMAVIVITPIIDIIVSRGSGYKLTYLSGFEQIAEVHKFFDFTKDLIQASWGQRIEILLVLIGGFSYVLLKTKNYFKAILASITIYLIIFLHGVLPNTIAKLPSYLGSNILSFSTIMTDGVLPIDSQNYAVVFSLSIILVGFLILKRSKRELAKKIFNFRSPSFIIIFLCLGILYGVFLVLPFYPFIFYSSFSYLIFILAVFSFVFANAATFTSNSSLELQILIIACILFSITLGPVFLFLITMFFLFKKFLKTKWLVVIPCFLAGFSIIYQEYTFKTIIPINKKALVVKGRKLAGWAYFLNADYQKALNQYIKVYLLSKEDEIILRLGQSYLNLGYVDKGIEILEKVKDPGYETFISLGQVYTQKGEYIKAIQIYKTAIKENIEPAEFYIKIAHIAARKGLEEEMALAIERGLLYGSPKYKIYQIKGDYYLGKGELKRALKMYNKALYYNSRAVAALASTGIIYYNQNDLRRAEEQFLKALKFEPNNDAIYNNLGAIYLVADRYEEAEKLFRKSIKKNPNQTEAYYNLGLIYEKMGRAKDALVMYNKALKVNSSYMPARRKIDGIEK